MLQFTGKISNATKAVKNKISQLRDAYILFTVNRSIGSYTSFFA